MFLRLVLAVALCFSLELHAEEGAEPVPTFLRPTIYYKPIIKITEGRCNRSEIVDMLSPDDKILTSLCLFDFNNCIMQGACYVHDELGRFRLFNYFARGLDGVPRFKEVDSRKCPYGYGMRNVCLDPYFSVAADLHVYKMGDVIFVPRMVGARMPDGEIHDGFFVIRDTGAAIKGPERFDFYTGIIRPFAATNPFFILGFADIKNSFEFRLATEEEALRVRARTMYPGLRKEILPPPGN